MCFSVVVVVVVVVVVTKYWSIKSLYFHPFVSKVERKVIILHQSKIVYLFA